MSREDRRALTVFALAFLALATYLINPQFVAGLIWDFYSELFIFLGWR
jgi:hypothetical protein